VDVKAFELLTQRHEALTGRFEALTGRFEALTEHSNTLSVDKAALTARLQKAEQHLAGMYRGVSPVVLSDHASVTTDRCIAPRSLQIDHSIGIGLVELKVRARQSMIEDGFQELITAAEESPKYASTADMYLGMNKLKIEGDEC
jgi:hypothetical protein